MAAGVAAAGLLMVAASANADDTGRLNTAAPDGYGGYAYWTENGDKVTACDTESEGWGVRAYIYTPYAGDPENGTVLIKVNAPSAASGCASSSVNISETANISLKVCEYAGSWVGYCNYLSIPR